MAIISYILKNYHKSTVKGNPVKIVRASSSLLYNIIEKGVK